MLLIPKLLIVIHPSYEGLKLLFFSFYLGSFILSPHDCWHLISLSIIRLSFLLFILIQSSRKPVEKPWSLSHSCMSEPFQPCGSHWKTAACVLFLPAHTDWSVTQAPFWMETGSGLSWVNLPEARVTDVLLDTRAHAISQIQPSSLW